MKVCVLLKVLFECSWLADVLLAGESTVDAVFEVGRELDVSVHNACLAAKQLLKVVLNPQLLQDLSYEKSVAARHDDALEPSFPTHVLKQLFEALRQPALPHFTKDLLYCKLFLHLTQYFLHVLKEIRKCVRDLTRGLLRRV